MHGAAAQEIAAENHGPVLQPADVLERPEQGVDVEKRLRRMLVLSGTRVQDRHRTVAVGKLPRHLLRKALLRRTHDYHVEVAGERADRVLARLALELRRRRRVAHAASGEAEDLAGGEVREEGARARLREVEHRALVREEGLEVKRALLRFRHEPYTVGKGGKAFEQGPVELLREERFPTQRYTPNFSYSRNDENHDG